jgi:formylglycine-generating enzyme required for sulfatase activity
VLVARVAIAWALLLPAGCSEKPTFCSGRAPPLACPTNVTGTPLVAAGFTQGTVCIEATEVTRAQYAEWLASGPFPEKSPCADTDYAPSQPIDDTLLSHPVAFVDWCDASAYCTAHGKRLCAGFGGRSLSPAAATDPCASEWFAVCSNAGTQDYPYGSTREATKCNDHALATVPVGQRTDCVGPDGVLDLSGNVYEWIGACDTSGCVIIGGSYNLDEAPCTTTDRYPPSDHRGVTGFRCCADPIAP